MTEVVTFSVVTSSGWRGPPKRRYPTISLHSAITQKTTTWTCTVKKALLGKETSIKNLTPCSRVLLENLNSNSASQEIPCLLWNPKVHYRVHNSPPLVPILTYLHPVHIFRPYFPKTRSNIIFPLRPGLLRGLFRFFNQNTVCISHLFRSCYVPRPSHPP